MAGGRVDSDVWVCACASVCLSACLPVYLCTYRYAVVNNLGVTCWIVSSVSQLKNAGGNK